MGSDHLDVPATARAPAELPQLVGGTLVVVQHLVHVVGVERSGPPAVDRRRDVAYQLVQAGLVIGGHLLAAGAPPGLVVGPRRCPTAATVSEPGPVNHLG